jgi:hypothetical protein
MMKNIEIPPQRQTQQPGLESKMVPQPDSTLKNYKGSDKL